MTSSRNIFLCFSFAAVTNISFEVLNYVQWETYIGVSYKTFFMSKFTQMAAERRHAVVSVNFSGQVTLRWLIYARARVCVCVYTG